MKTNDLKVEGDANGTTLVKVWAECRSVEDIDDIVAWLRLAKSMISKWEKIRNRHAKASHAPEAAAGKNENIKPREIQRAAQV